MKHCKNKSNLAVVQDYLDGVRPFSTFGYDGKKYIKRKVGERWEEKGIEWEQKESGPVRINRVANIVREAIGKEICKCGQEIRFGNSKDQILYRKTGLCSNCLIDYETKLRILGIYDSYEGYKLISNEIGFFKDIKDKVSDAVKYFSSDNGDVTAICNSDGFIERWKNTNRDQILEDAKRDLKLVRQRILDLSKKRKEFKKKFLEDSKKFNLETYV